MSSTTIKEIWKDIPEYEGLYQVSNVGRVKRLEKKTIRNGAVTLLRERMISCFKESRGYLQTILWKNNSRKQLMVARLVAKAFIPNPDNKEQVNHKDGNRTNNNITNLEWVTCKENINHAFKVLKRKAGQQGKFGKDHPASKKLAQYTLDNKLIKVWDSFIDAKRAGINTSNVSRVLSGKYKQSAGFRWGVAV